MNEPESKSEVARIMRQIDLELEAAQRGLHGFAATARHDLITARMQRGGERILLLIEEGKHEEARALMNAGNWEIKGQETDEETTHGGIREDHQERGIRQEDNQGIKKMKQRQVSELPTLPIGFNDLAVLRSIISGYLAYLRRTVAHSQHRQTQMHLLEAIYLRLTGISPQAVEARIFLSVAEVEALNTAILGFAAFVRQKVSPSTERDETLQTLELLRQHLLTML